MLKPIDLTSDQYKVALKPSLGYEKQLLVSTQQHTDLGVLAITAANVGVYSPNVADNAQLLAIPQELFVTLDSDVLGTAACVVTIIGTDQADAILTGIATFRPPGYAQDQTFGFPKGWAHQVEVTAGKMFKTITSVTPTTANASWVGVHLHVFGVPTADDTSAGTFRLINTKVSLNFDPKTPMPTAIQSGRDKGAYIKPGEIEIGALEISSKIPCAADSLSRVNGRRVTGWIRELKEDKINTQNIFILGLIMTSKEKNGESVEPSTLDATSMYEVFAFILAH